MKLVSVLGSPVKDGNSATILSKYLSNLKEIKANLQIEEIYVGNGSVNPCVTCNSCKPVGDCVINDDMQKYYPMIMEADIIVFATPVYWFHMAAQLKAFIDRFYGLDYENFPKGKKLVLISTFMGKTKESSGAINIENSFKQMASFLSMDYKYHIGINYSYINSEETNLLIKQKAKELF